MLGLIIPIIVAVQFYRAANENNKNGILWAIISFVTYFATQILVQFLIAIVISIVAVAFYGVADTEIEALVNKWSILIAVAGLLVSLPVIYFLYRYVVRVPDSDFHTPPPPPPQF